MGGSRLRDLTKGSHTQRFNCILSLRVNYFRILFDFCFNLSYLLSLLQTVFVFLFTVEVYSSSQSFSYIEDDGSGCTNNKDRYMRINKDKCENKNSRRECPAMADEETSSYSSTRKLAGFLMCSTAVSHFPSQNYLITEKIYKQKNSYFITNGRSIRADLRTGTGQRVSSEVIRLPSVTFHLKII